MLFQSLSVLDLAAWVATASLKGAVLIAAVMLCRRLLAPATTSLWRHALWLPVLACLICPLGPSVSLTGPFTATLPALLAAPLTTLIAESTPTAQEAAADAGPRRLTAPLGAQPVSTGSATPDQAVSADATRPGALLSWLILIWAAGVGAIALLYLSTLLKFRRIRRAAGAAEAVAVAIFEACKAELCVRRNVRLLQSAAIGSPTVVGWWRPTILLPCGLDARIDILQLRHVLLHELAHVKRNDILVNWLAAIAQLLHWFNPLVWLAGRLMRADMESASDALVLCRLSRAERAEYGDVLIRLADSDVGRTSPRHGLGIAGHGDLKSRLSMIGQFRPASLAAKVAAGIALVAFVGVALIQPTLSSPLPAGKVVQDANAAGPDGEQRLLYEESRPQKQVAFPPNNFDGYAGYYRFADESLFARVYRSADRYYVQVTGNGPVEIFPASRSEFFATAVPAQISFTLDADGHVTAMTLHQAGFLQRAAPVSKAVYSTAARELQRRIAGKVPGPGTEASLRRQLEGWESGAPDYTDMGAALAAASREQHEQMQTMIRYLGAFEGLNFVNTNATGWDVYMATFANGTVKCLIAPLSTTGKVTALFYLP